MSRLVSFEECIRDGILREFLIKHKAEAREVSIFEYNEEEHMRMEREQHYAEGREEGLAEGRTTGRAEEQALLYMK